MIYTTILTVAFSILFFWVLYLLIFSVSAKFYHDQTRSANSQNTYAILIPAYKEDQVIINSVKENLQVDFDKNRFSLFVLADQLKSETLTELRTLGVKIITIETEKSTKAKAMNIGLEQVDPQKFSHVIVLDADNVMHDNFLHAIDSQLNENIEVIQAHRTAKNETGTIALLDAINEEIANSIFRKGHRKLGLSAALIGSGMVFKTELIKELMPNIVDTASEDKMLEFALLQNKIQVHYADKGLVYDEKVSNLNAFGTQRKRWITARLYYLKHFAKPAFIKLMLGNFDYFNKWLQFLLPQKTILLAYVVICSLLGFITPGFQVYAISLLGLTALAFGLAIPKELRNKIGLKTIVGLFTTVISVIKALIKSTNADHTQFEVTQKNV